MIEPIKHYYPNGNIKSILYFLDGNYHNPNGPAFIHHYENGNKACEQYYINGILHNENGYAWIFYNLNGIKEEKYYLNGECLEQIKSIEELKKYIKLNNIS